MRSAGREGETWTAGGGRVAARKTRWAGTMHEALVNSPVFCITWLTRYVWQHRPHSRTVQLFFCVVLLSIHFFFPPLFPALRNTQLQLVAQHSDTNLEHFNGFILTYPFKQECRHMELGMSDVNMSSISSSSSRSVLGSGGGGSSSSGSNSILLHFLADSTA